MNKLSDKELVDDICSNIWQGRRAKYKAELLRRLDKGRKAIGLIDKLLKDREQALSRSERLELLNCYLADYEKE